MNPSRLFIDRPIATSLLMIAIFIAGLFAYQLLPISSLPQIDYPTIQVATFYPGASPYVTASYITAPLERQFGQMQGLSQMTSSSSNGASVITLQFDLNLSLDVAEQEVQAAINNASTFLPRDLPYPPIYSKINPADTPVITLALTSNIWPLSQVEDFADTRFSQRISQLPGVGLVSISGGQRPAVRIQLNTNALASYGIDLEDVRNAVAANNVNAAKGNFDGPQLSYTINSNDQLLSAKEYRPLIIAYKNNAPVRLSDIAKVIDGVENTRLAAWMNKEPAVIVNVQRQPGSNVIAVTDRVKQLLSSLQVLVPPAIQVWVLTDRTLSIRASVNNVKFELVLSVALVVLVIFLFLRNLPATLIPSISVPVSLVGTFGMMYFLGFSIDNLSLMALTIAAGFVVDDAIVMIENITRYIEQGDPPREASLKGSKQIGFTIISLTVSLIGVLIPLLFMTDIIGRLFREFAMTLAVTILISAFVSLTLTPMLCSRILQKQKEKNDNAFEEKSLKIQQNILDRYAVSLKWVLDNQGLILLVALITLLISLFLFYIIPKGFFPIQDTGLIQGITNAPEDISFTAMAKRQEELGKIIYNDPAVESFSSIIGIDGTNKTLNSGRLLITLKPLNQRVKATDVIRQLQKKLEKVSGISLYMQPVQDITVDNRVSRTQYQFSVNSPYEDEVREGAQALTKKLNSLPQIRDVTNDLQSRGLQTTILIDRNNASRLGITAQYLDDTLYDAFGQRQISTMFTQRNQYRVVLEALPKIQLDPSALQHIYFKNTNGLAIPLSTFITVKQQNGPLVINRQGQFPVSTISFNLAPNAALGDAIRAINQAKTELNLPASVVTSFEGSAKIFQNSLHNEGWLVLAAILVVYIVLGVLYESYIHPITILSTLPSACAGALLALYLAGDALSIIALIGIILLIGIVMKNAILMIDFALEQERQYQKTPREAIYEACLLRFRPILMTTMAAMLGAVPLAIGWGMGEELRRPLGLAIVAGLAVSQLLTLYTTPVIYLTFDNLARRFAEQRKRWLGPAAEEAL